MKKSEHSLSEHTELIVSNQVRIELIVSNQVRIELIVFDSFKSSPDRFTVHRSHGHTVLVFFILFCVEFCLIDDLNYHLLYIDN